MQEQFKYRYFIDGKEISTREEYFNTTMSGDYVSYFDGDSVFSVSFNSFFGEYEERVPNKDNNKMIKREINGHLSDVIKADQINTREQLVEKLTDEAVRDFGSPLLKAIHKLKQEENKNLTFDPTKPPTEMYVTDILDLGQVKGSSTRHKSQNGETHVEIKIKSDDGEVNCNAILDYKFSITDIKVPIKYDNLEYYAEKDYFIVTESACWNVLDFNIKNPHVLLIDTTPVEIKADWIDFISGGIKRGKIINYENPAEKTEKELEFKSISKYNIKGRGDVILVQAKSKESLLGKEVLIDGERYKVKGVETQGYLEVGNKIGLLVSKIAEKENKEQSSKTEENLVFQKDSEIHKDDVITKISRGEKETIEYLKPSIVSELGEELHFDKDFNLIKSGVKETNGKTDYSEIDWDFIEGLAKRMNKNKEKYEPFNYHKPMDVNLLKQSLLRHIIEILKGEHKDAGQEYGHLFAVALNSMMIYYQLKNNS